MWVKPFLETYKESFKYIYKAKERIAKCIELNMQVAVWHLMSMFITSDVALLVTTAFSMLLSARQHSAISIIQTFSGLSDQDAKGCLLKVVFHTAIFDDAVMSGQV